MNVQRSPQNENTTPQPDQPKQNESTKRKRKLPGSDSGFQEASNDFPKQMLHSFEELLGSQHAKLRQDLKDLKSEMCNIKVICANIVLKQATIKQDLANLKASYEKTESRLDHEREKVESTLTALIKKLQTKAQQDCANNLEVSGVPFTEGENLYGIINNIAIKIDFPLQPYDIDFIHRVPRFASNKDNTTESGQSVSSIQNIVVRFTQRKRKSDLVAAVRARRGLTTEDAGLDGVATPILINDHLTPQNKVLYKIARQLGKDKGYKAIWISECKILKKKERSSPILISSESD